MNQDENIVYEGLGGVEQNPQSQDQTAPVGQESSQQPPQPESPQNPLDSTPPVVVNPLDVPQGVQDSSQAQPPSSPPPPIKTGILGGGLLKKVLIGLGVLVLIIIIVVIFAPKDKTPEDASLIWWGLWEDQAVVEPLIDDFQKENPNITVNYIKQDPQQYREKLVARISNNTEDAPDIFRFHNTWVPMLSDFLLPLSDDVINPDDFKKSFYPVMQSDLVQNGAIYGIPLGADTLALFINTELLEASGEDAPDNWDDFIKTARAMTVKDSDGRIITAGAALGTYNNVTHAPDIISLLMVQQGVDMRKFPESSADKVGTLDFYTSFATGSQNVWDSTLDDSIVAFAGGRLAMYIGYSWDIFTIQGLNPDLGFQVYPVPQLPGTETTIASYWVEGISSKSQNQDAALLFMKYLAQKETAEKFYTTVAKTRAFGELYARTDLAESLSDNPLIFPFVSQLDKAQSSFFVGNTQDGEGGINSSSNVYIENAVNSITNEGASVQTVIETLNSGIGQVYEKYGVR